MFSFNERLGIFFTIEGSFLSLFSVSSVLCFVVYKWLRRTVLTWGKSKVLSPDASDSSIFLNLMLADLVQSLGNLPNIRWMEDGEITEGHLCTAQAAIKQVGIVGVAMTSLAIAVHTFSVLVLRWKAPPYLSKITVVGVWVFTALVIGIANAIHRNESYYGNTGYWCWILEKYETELIVTEYLWVWVSGFSMIILYGIMFVVMRGWFIIDNGVHWHKNYKSNQLAIEVETEEDKESKAIANLMLFYPAIYIVCFLPNTVSRWLTFRGFHTPYQFTLFASTLYSLSGVFNVILFFSTRPQLVKGSNIVIESAEDLPLHHRKDSSGAPTSHKLGRLPERKYTDASPIGDRWTGKPDFDAGSLVADHDAFPSSTAYDGGSLGRHARNESYLSERDEYKRSRESSSLIEEEDYGHLPG
ncbi:hypothetical protein GALMADRAFT_79777 [Galerina marginata CBS 339.88]|uniref:Uncharacterized protein n=1 Tax=Galerina marginata (strain CBS 339.88) TaxID=685588 RepID=A0A067SIM3_GALM3|nr:hypothetical protein GALMADRAFT_79777 [Galerina marginata CBS 339.88]